MEENENLCLQCGGLIRIAYTIGFEQGKPVDIQVIPETMHKLCSGHLACNSHSQDELLSSDQRYALASVRRKIHDAMAKETQEFHAQYPLLRLEWDYTLDVFI